MAPGENPVFHLKFEVPSDPRLLSVVRSAVTQLAAVAGLPEQDCRGVTRALDEALSNIIRHAYQNQSGQPIEVSCRRLPADPSGRPGNRLEFLLEDWGRSVDASTLQGRSLDEVRPGGLGLHIIRSIMDEVEYQPFGDHNRLRLVKYLRDSGPAGDGEGE